MAHAPVHTASPRSPSARLIVIFAVCAALALILRAVDSVPPWWLGEPRGLVSYGSVHDVERQQRTRLLVPFVFPDSLVWPPSRIVLVPGAGRPVQLEFVRADGSGAGLQLTQTLDGDFPPPQRLVPPIPLVPFDQPATTDDPAVWRGTDLRGRVFLEISQIVEGRRVVMRWFDQDPVPLRRMARSLRRG
jgi:hypothetical protein